jgi:hypothetical protein
MQTVIGIVICLIVGIYFLIGFMNTHENNGYSGLYEGLETATATAPTTVPLTTAVANSTNAVLTLKTKVAAVNNGDNKSLYVKHIDNLLDYCDLSILNIINNATLDAEAKYDAKYLDEIVRYSKIKEALTGSQAFLDLAN